MGRRPWQRGREIEGVGRLVHGSNARNGGSQQGRHATMYLLCSYLPNPPGSSKNRTRQEQKEPPLQHKRRRPAQSQPYAVRKQKIENETAAILCSATGRPAPRSREKRASRLSNCPRSAQAMDNTSIFFPIVLVASRSSVAGKTSRRKRTCDIRSFHHTHTNDRPLGSAVVRPTSHR